MSVIGSNVLAGASGQAGAAGYEIERSLRFNSGDSAYLNRTPSSAGNRKTWTWAGWVKRSELGSYQAIFTADASSGTSANGIWWADDDSLYFFFGGNSLSTAVFRDLSAWYHIVCSLDTTQGTDTDRFKVWINNQQITQWASVTWPSSNTDYGINNSVEHDIGRKFNGSNPSNFYLADVHFIDGQALAATDFGEYDDNNVWQPIEYAGTYGTNGFHLDFADNSSNAALGYDAAGSNDWTVNNLVATAPGLETANQGFDVVTYTGNGSTQSISGLGFQPDLVWIKGRSSVFWHELNDAVRGAGKSLFSNDTNAEATINTLTSFNSNGFTVAIGSGGQTGTNNNNDTYVAWCWKAGGAATTLTAGSVDAQVSASTDYGFSIITATMPSTSNLGCTVAHGLGSAPAMYIVKDRDLAISWGVYHQGLSSPATKALQLNSTGAEFDATNYWKSTSPTSSVLSIGTSIISEGNDFVVYAWSEVSGFSKLGSYTGTGLSSGNVITVGFKPRYVLIKNTSRASAWRIYDTARGNDKVVNPNTAGAEFTTGDPLNFTNTSFEPTGTTNEDTNKSGDTYIYAAFADKPPGEIIDSLIDTPTNYEADSGNNGGNYATLNPLQKSSGSTLSNGNLDISMSSAQGTTFATMAFPASGKWYFECTANASQSDIGIAKAGADLSQYLGKNSSGYGYYVDGNVYNNDASAGSGASYTTGDVIGVAFDADAGTCKWYKNNSLQVTISSLSGEWFPAFGSGSAAGIFNFGARPFAYTPPTGHLSLCTQNLPDPTIADGSTAMEAKLYTGNASTQAVTGLNFSPDLVWLKRRDGAGNHNLQDVVRGASAVIQSDYNGAEFTNGARLASFDSNGFTLTSDNGANTSGGTYIGWAWDGGTSTVSNTDGSITSSVRANASAGFSIVTWNPGTTSSGTIGHGLGAAPSLIIVKNRTSTSNWPIYHASTGNGGVIWLNLTDTFSPGNAWNNTSPTSNVFSYGNNGNTYVANNDFVAYCFAPVEGYSAFGSYTGNGSADGPFIYTGFRPRWIVCKPSSTTGAWQINDAARNTYNVVDAQLFADFSNAESTTADRYVDFLSNGFKLRGNNASLNGSGSTYIYAAFGDPFKTARAR